MVDKKNIVPRVGVGTWALAGDYWGEQNHSDSKKMIHAAIREGFKLFDTAPAYGNGKSEQLLGQQLPKENCIISTKCFTKPLSSFQKSFENSLKRLNRESIDIFFIHWPSTKLDSKPIMEYLEKLRSVGKIQYIGVSNFNTEQLVEIQKAGKVDIVQNPFNLFWRYDLDFFSYCKKNDIITQAYSPLAQGLLTGKFSSTNPYIKSDHRFMMSLFSEKNLSVIYKYIDSLIDLSKKTDIPLSKMALSWTLANPFIDSIIVGCRNRTQLENLVNIENLQLPNEILLQMEDISINASKELDKGINFFNHSY